MRSQSHTAASLAGHGALVSTCAMLTQNAHVSQVLVDDMLPVTSSARRPDLASAGGHMLAFSRCGSGMGGPSHQMLWACLLEKAYAKAHGSYKSTSGGEIQEALLDLTGAPTLSVNFEAVGFDSELLWRSMSDWKRLGLPMGCATGGDNGELKEMGLCGGHAYSVLSVREVRLRGGQSWGGGRAEAARTERLVHVRNPHGVRTIMPMAMAGTVAPAT